MAAPGGADSQGCLRLRPAPEGSGFGLKLEVLTATQSTGLVLSLAGSFLGPLGSWSPVPALWSAGWHGAGPGSPRPAQQPLGIDCFSARTEPADAVYCCPQAGRQVQTCLQIPAVRASRRPASPGPRAHGHPDSQG